MLSSAVRKTAGSLVIRDLSDIVKEEDIFTSDYMTTVLVAIPKYSLKEWNSTYEKLNPFIVSFLVSYFKFNNLFSYQDLLKLYLKIMTMPWHDLLFSQKKSTDLEQMPVSKATKYYMLFILNLKIKLKVRDYNISSEVDTSQPTQSIEQLREEGTAKRQDLEQWCRTSYGEVDLFKF